MVYLPVKPLGPFEHIHEGKSKWLKYCSPEFSIVLFYDMRQKYFALGMKYFIVMIFIFSYTTYLVEKVLFYALRKIKVSPQSTLYMKYFVVMDIYFFIYSVPGGETFILCSNKIKISPQYVVYEKINIHNNEIFYVRLAILQKTTEETCKNAR